MRFGHEEHSSHQVRGRNALRALTFPVTTFPLHLFIAVFTFHCQGDVIWKTQTTVHVSRNVTGSEGFTPAAHLHAHRSHSCTCPGSPGWWRKGLLRLSHPPTWWHAPFYNVLPEWRPEDLYVWKSQLQEENNTYYKRYKWTNKCGKWFPSRSTHLITLKPIWKFADVLARLCPVKLPRCNYIILPAINYGKDRQSVIKVTWIR